MRYLSGPDFVQVLKDAKFYTFFFSNLLIAVAGSFIQGLISREDLGEEE